MFDICFPNKKNWASHGAQQPYTRPTSIKTSHTNLSLTPFTSFPDSHFSVSSSQLEEKANFSSFGVPLKCCYRTSYSISHKPNYPFFLQACPRCWRNRWRGWVILLFFQFFAFRTLQFHSVFRYDDDSGGNKNHCNFGFEFKSRVIALIQFHLQMNIYILRWSIQLPGVWIWARIKQAFIQKWWHTKSIDEKLIFLPWWLILLEWEFPWPPMPLLRFC